MSCKLPYGEFEWVNGDDLSINDIMNYNEDTDNKAYVLEVDLEYPNELYMIYIMIILLLVRNTNQNGIIVINYVEHFTIKRID